MDVREAVIVFVGMAEADSARVATAVFILKDDFVEDGEAIDARLWRGWLGAKGERGVWVW